MRAGSFSTHLKELRKLSWSGIPRQVRPITWKLLSGYLPANVERRASTLQRKRQEYFGFIEQYYDSRNDEHHQDTYRQIHIDIPRMSPESLILQPRVTEIFERILFIWAIRHPASGYVQGINDLVTPFFVVFVFEYIEEEVENFDVSSLQEDALRNIEADSFWCMSKLLDGIQWDAAATITHKAAEMGNVLFLLPPVVYHIKDSELSTPEGSWVKCDQINECLGAKLYPIGCEELVSWRGQYHLQLMLSPFVVCATPCCALGLQQGDGTAVLHNVLSKAVNYCTLSESLTAKPCLVPGKDNYTFAQPGIQRKVQALEELVSRIDEMPDGQNLFSTPLLSFESQAFLWENAIICKVFMCIYGHLSTESVHRHMQKYEVEYLQFAFRWMNNLLMRELPLRCTIRLWDTYQAEPEGFSHFHLYVCAAFLVRWRKEILEEKDFQGLMILLQNLPTMHWGNEEISVLLAEAYRLKFAFADAPNHYKR
ncbi:hypothetical protein Z043_102829 [Scleropages formosus]|uniref:Rab-GAP TBC domain-containing protein n=1 Tax=Scleropages formosus TaxID=113540 RepID=A0A0P7XLN7_SCLFO|nr:hypothetical protein Z043_102829 [Scleropages formosus]